MSLFDPSHPFGEMAAIGDIVMMDSMHDADLNFCGVFDDYTLHPRTLSVGGVVFDASPSGSLDHWIPRENELGLHGVYFAAITDGMDHDPVLGVGNLNPGDGPDQLPPDEYTPPEPAVINPPKDVIDDVPDNDHEGDEDDQL